MNQNLISGPLDTDCQLKHEKCQNNTINYISKRYTYFQGIQNNVWYFSTNQESIFISFYPFSLNRLIKLIRKRKLQILNGVFTFTNQSNQLIVQTWQSIQIWSLDKLDTQDFKKTISTFQVGKDNEQHHCFKMNRYYEQFDEMQCHGLNDKDDLLVVANQYYNLIFWQKTCGEEWICQDSLHFPYCIQKLKFNEQGTLLIAQIEPQLIIFSKSLNDEQWKIIYKIEPEQECPLLCFLSNEIFAYREQSFIYFWKVSICSLKVDFLQKLEVQSSNEQLQDKCGFINYSQSKDVLIAFYQGILYKIKNNKKQYFISQIIQIQNNPARVICCNQRELLLSIFLNIGQYKTNKISIQRIS